LTAERQLGKIKREFILKEGIMVKRYIRCPTCKQVIGVLMFKSVDMEENKFLWLIRCPGKDRHTKQETSSITSLFGIVEEITMHYPETETSERRYLYTGPPSIPVFLFALLFFVKKHPHEFYKMIRVGKRTFVLMPPTRRSWKQLRSLFRNNRPFSQ
jgi:hypothetical protein